MSANHDLIVNLESAMSYNTPLVKENEGKAISANLLRTIKLVGDKARCDLVRCETRRVFTFVETVEKRKAFLSSAF